MFPKREKIKIPNSRHCNCSQFKIITTYKSQKWLMFQNINTSKTQIFKSPIWSRTPVSSVSWFTCQIICSRIINHLIIATRTQIGWAMHIKTNLNMIPIPIKIYWYMLITNYPPLISYSFMSHMPETRSWNFYCASTKLSLSWSNPTSQSCS